MTYMLQIPHNAVSVNAAVAAVAWMFPFHISPRKGSCETQVRTVWALGYNWQPLVSGPKPPNTRHIEGQRMCGRRCGLSSEARWWTRESTLQTINPFYPTPKLPSNVYSKRKESMTPSPTHGK